MKIPTRISPEEIGFSPQFPRFGTRFFLNKGNQKVLAAERVGDITFQKIHVQGPTMSEA